MRIMPERRLVTLFMLLIAAAASGWWLYRGDDAVIADSEPVHEEFDYSLTEFELVEMDAQGELKHALIAENLYHYPDTEQSTLARPRLLFYEDSRMAWEISAVQGLIRESDRSVLLSGEVHIRYASVSEIQDFEVFTDQILVWPDDRIAETGDPVRIEQDRGVTYSTGMRAEFDMRRIHLLSDVRSDYVP
jgi:lipopolysaccharide export system protein LptC